MSKEPVNLHCINPALGPLTNSLSVRAAVGPALHSNPPRQQVASEPFACRVTGQHRASQRHQSATTTPADPDAALRTWLRAYAKDHPRRGSRPAYHVARGEGRQVDHKKIQRLWRDEGLRAPSQRPVARWSRRPPPVLRQPSQATTAPLPVTDRRPNPRVQPTRQPAGRTRPRTRALTPPRTQAVAGASSPSDSQVPSIDEVEGTFCRSFGYRFSSRESTSFGVGLA